MQTEHVLDILFAAGEGDSGFANHFEFVFNNATHDTKIREHIRFTDMLSFEKAQASLSETRDYKNLTLVTIWSGKSEGQIGEITSLIQSAEELLGSDQIVEIILDGEGGFLPPNSNAKLISPVPADGTSANVHVAVEELVRHLMSLLDHTDLSSQGKLKHDVAFAQIFQDAEVVASQSLTQALKDVAATITGDNERFEPRLGFVPELLRVLFEQGSDARSANHACWLLRHHKQRLDDDKVPPA